MNCCTLLLLFTLILFNVTNSANVDEEDTSMRKFENVHAYRRTEHYQRTEFVTVRLGFCMGPKTRIVWWYEFYHYVLNLEKCKMVREITGPSHLYTHLERRLQCEVQASPGHVSLTFGKQSSLLVSLRLQECQTEWISVRDAMRSGMQHLEPQENAQRQQIHQDWFLEFLASTPALSYASESEESNTFQGILSDIPKLGIEFEFTSASFENCTWRYGDLLGYTKRADSEETLIIWTAEDACAIELLTIPRSIDHTQGKQLIFASFLTAYVTWSKMLKENVSFTQIVDSVKGSFDASKIFPPETLPLVRKRIGSDSLSLSTKVKDGLEISTQLKLKHTNRETTTGLSAQLNIGIPFLVYDPVCLEALQNAGVLIQNDNPIPRAMSQLEYIDRIKKYKDSYIRAMLGYLLEIFLTVKYQAMEKGIMNNRNDYNVLPKVNWQECNDPYPLRCRPNDRDYALYRNGLRVFKREFAREITESGVELGSNPWRELTAIFRSPRAVDIFRIHQPEVKKHTFKPFLYNDQIYIVVEFRGVGFRGRMSGKLNLLMMRGLSDASHFNSGETYLFPDLYKLDRIFERVKSLQTMRFNSQNMPILGETSRPSDPITPLEIDVRQEFEIPSKFQSINFYIIFIIIMLLGVVFISFGLQRIFNFLGFQKNDFLNALRDEDDT